jgi:hypothetical protein
MRRSILLAGVLAVCLAPGAASAKLSSIGFEVDPLHPKAGEPITITMMCYLGRDHTQAISSCFGNEGVMAWVHPLDGEGEFDRDDWIAVYGHPTPTGATRGRVVLDEPGPYDVLPLWRRWSDRSAGGLPGIVRIEVGRRASPVPTAISFAFLGLVVLTWRRRARNRHT